MSFVAVEANSTVPTSSSFARGFGFGDHVLGIAHTENTPTIASSSVLVQASSPKKDSYAPKPIIPTKNPVTKPINPFPYHTPIVSTKPSGYHYPIFQTRKPTTPSKGVRGYGKPSLIDSIFTKTPISFLDIVEDNQVIGGIVKDNGVNGGTVKDNGDNGSSVKDNGANIDNGANEGTGKKSKGVDSSGKADGGNDLKKEEEEDED